MSDPKRTLRDGAKQLQKLHKDLHPPTLSRRDWKDNVFARQSLGDDVEVELWYLAEHFLLAWHDWHTLKDRFPRYFGESDEPFPATWQRLDGHCFALANRLLQDKGLEELVFDSWMTTGVVGGDRQDATPSFREVYQTVVQNHRRWSLMKRAEEGRFEAGVADSEKVGSPEEVWPQCRKLVRRLNEATLETCQRSMEALGRDLRFHLRHYRHANLLVSWLADGDAQYAQDQGASPLRPGDARGDGSGYGYGDGHGGGRGDGRHSDPGIGLGRSALIQLLWEKPMIPSIDQYVNQCQDPDIRGGARHVLERITQTIGEIGYDEFVEDVTSSDFHGGAQSLVGASSINLIPKRVRKSLLTLDSAHGSLGARRDCHE